MRSFIARPNNRGRDASERVGSLRRQLANRTGYDPSLHLPPDGDYYLVCAVAPPQEAQARAFALALSKQFRQTWFVVGRLFVRDRTFWRRRFGTQLTLVRASNIHLPRELRSVLRGIL